MRENDDISLKKASEIAIACMLALLAGAIAFYKERMLFLDASLISFGRMNSLDFAIQEHRYGSFITQLFPLLGAKTHLGVKAILIAYSASFNLFYLVVALILVYYHKQYGMAILMAIYYTLFVSDSYFWTNNEVHQGVAWMFLFFAVAFEMAKKKRKLAIQVLVFILLLALATFTHPLVSISVIYLWFFWLADKRSWPYSNPRSVLFTILLLVVCFVKFFVSNGQGYDGSRMHNAVHVSFQDIFYTFKCLLADTFWQDCLRNYWWALLIFAWGIVVLVREKRYLQLAGTLAFSVGYFILVALAYGPNAYDYHVHFYMESEWMTLAIPISAPFVFYSLPKLSGMKARWLLAALFITRFVYILITLPLFERNVAFIERALEQMKKKNLTKVVIVKRDGRVEEATLMDWGLCYESLLASKLNGDTPQRTFLSLAEQSLTPDRLPADNKMMVSCFGWEIIEKGSNFKIDTTRPYKVMSYDELFDK